MTLIAGIANLIWSLVKTSKNAAEGNETAKADVGFWGILIGVGLIIYVTIRILI